MDSPVYPDDVLISLALIVQGNAYAPYSKYKVGVCLLARHPRMGTYQLFTGVNVENASYGLTICAERAAIFSAISAGYTDLISLVCVTEDGKGTSCGACRQVEYEFSPDMSVHFCNELGEILSTRTPREMLPDAFTLEKDK